MPTFDNGEGGLSVRTKINNAITKVDGMEEGATADQTGAEIKALYEAEPDTNAFTDADHSKLDGIESGATADQTGAEIGTALGGETIGGSLTIAGDLDLENGTTATQIKFYNTYTDASNYERFQFGWFSNEVLFRTQAAGTGTVRDMSFLGGNIGVNTSAAAQSLQVAAGSNYEGILLNGATVPNLCFARGVSTTQEWKLGISANNGNNFSISTGTINADELVIDTSGNVFPGTDDAQDLGTATYRWDDVYATNGTIQTSDEREKTDIGPLSDTEVRIAQRIKDECWKKYRWKESVSEKGEAARFHFGVIAQDVEAICIEEGLGTDSLSFFIRAPKYKRVEKTRTVERQKTKRVQETRDVVEIIDGVPTLVPKTETVDSRVYEDRPLMKDGEAVMQSVIVGADQENNPILEDRVVTYPVPIMESVEETYFEELPDGDRLGIRYVELHNFLWSAGVT